MGKVGRRPQAAKPPLRETEPVYYRPLIRPLRGHLPPLWGEGIRAAKGRPYGVGDPPRRAGEDTRPYANTGTAPFPS